RPMQTHCPVLCGSEIDRVRIVAELSDTSLHELDGMRIARFDRSLDDLRFRNRRVVMVINSNITAICSNPGCYRLKHAAKRDALQRYRQIREQDAKCCGCRHSVNEDNRVTICVREI